MGTAGIIALVMWGALGALGHLRWCLNYHGRTGSKIPAVEIAAMTIPAMVAGPFTFIPHPWDAR